MSKTINPAGAVESFAPLLRPIAQLDFGSARSGRKDAIRSENYRRGYDEGFQQGRVDGEEAIREELERANNAQVEAFARALDAKAEQIDQAFQDWCAALEGPMAELAVAVATRVVARELETSPEAILDIVRQAIADVTHATSARIRVNPFDVPLIQEHAPVLLSASSCLRKIDVVDDPNILGGCIVETEGGSVDARVEGMIEQARKAIRGTG